MSAGEIPRETGRDRQVGGQVRLDYVSPLPPVRSGIADYSADLLPHLETRCDLRVVAVPGQPVAPELRERWAPVAFDRLGEEGRLPLYQVGNNPHHAAIVERAAASPGVVTLHDFVLHHLLQERTLAHADLDGYVRALTTDHGWIGGAVSLVPRWHGYGRSALFALPAHRSLLEAQRGVLVHSDWARRALIDEGITAPVATVPMPMPVPPEVPASRIAELGERLGLAGADLVVGSFGFQTPIKRTDVVLRALAAPGLERVVLIVGGASSPAVDLAAMAGELGVADRVRFTGYLDADDYATAVACCDLCVNLRYPSAGETSAALLRVASLGRPALVSSYAQFAELPEAVALQVPIDDQRPEQEVAAVAAVLRDGSARRDELRELGRRARRHVEREHDPGEVAERVVGILAEWSRRDGGDRATGVATAARAPRPTSLTWGRFEGALEVRGLDGWRAGERRELEIALTNASFARWLAAGRGPGGVALEVTLTGEDGEVERPPWLPLPVDLEPLATWRFRLRLRRPPGGSTLRIEPHVDGLGGLAAVGGPVFTATFGAEDRRETA